MNGNIPKEDVRSGAKRQSSGKGSVEGSELLDDSEVGAVLRTVYQKTVDEDIPAEMLDLLKKLT